MAAGIVESIALGLIAIFLASTLALFACCLLAMILVEGFNLAWRAVFGPAYCSRHAKRKSRWQK